MTIGERIKKIRDMMKERGIQAYIVPTADPHQTEYVGQHYKTREWISAFTGSAATVIISQEEALLWTDGRYFIQAEKELKGTEYKLMRMGEAGVASYPEWLKANLKKGDGLAFDGKTFAESLAKELEEELRDREIEFIDKYDLIGEIWEDRPSLSKEKIYIHDVKYAGLEAREKISQVRGIMKEKNIDYSLLSNLDDIAWLYNIRGTDIENSPIVISYALISMDKAYLFIDKDKVDSQVEKALKEEGVEILAYEDISNSLGEIEEDFSIILDENKINRYLYKSIPSRCKIINEMDITTGLKAIKNQVEIKNLENAYLKDGIALVKFLSWLDREIGKTPIDEISAAERLEAFRKEGELYTQPSFNSISAYGANAAMAHYRASADDYAKLAPKGLYLIDSGGQYYDGTTDITRTVALGELTEEEKRDFTLTLKGHINLISTKFLQGITGYQLDIICRQPIWKERLDYKHGTGHGIGFFLNVHEGPHRIASVGNHVAIDAGMVMSIEPGIYKDGKHGIRIENIVVARKDMKTEFGNFLSFKILSYVPIDLNCIEKKLLNEEEINWLNNYHKKVYEKLSAYLNQEERLWLEEKTKAI